MQLFPLDPDIVNKWELQRGKLYTLDNVSPTMEAFDAIAIDWSKSIPYPMYTLQLQ